MRAKSKTTNGKKVIAKATSTNGKKPAKVVAAYKPGSFLDRRGGMVPTVQLGKRASTAAN